MQKSKIIFFGLIIVIVLALAFFPWQNYSILGKALEPLLPADWENISKKDIIKNTVLLSLVEEKNDKCLVYSDKLTGMFDHAYFVRSSEMQEQLQYNEDNQTLLVPCENMLDDKIRLHLRYIQQDAPKDGTKFEYSFSEPDITLTNP